MARVLCLHTTESLVFKATKAYLDRNPGLQPHVLFDPATIEGHQFIPYDQPAKALRNLPGGVETNRRDGGVIQLEIIGRAADIPNESDDWYRRLADEVWMICNQVGIPLRFPRPFVPYPLSYGLAAPQRMTPTEWDACTGIVGHQHVPENHHGDPGDLNRLIPLIAQETPPVAPTSPRDTPVGQSQQAINAWLPEARRIAVDGDWGPKSTAALEFVLDQVAGPTIRDLEAANAVLTTTNTALTTRNKDLQAEIVALQHGADLSTETVTLAAVGALTRQWWEAINNELTRLDP